MGTATMEQPGEARIRRWEEKRARNSAAQRVLAGRQQPGFGGTPPGGPCPNTAAPVAAA